MQKTMLYEIPSLITRQRTVAFFTQTSDIPSPSYSISNTDIITKNFEISSEPNHTMKSIEEILESVPKSYHAHLLMKHLFRKVLDRISRDEHGIVIIDGNIVKDSNIADLINDAMRERKTVKAAGNQFARLLRISNIPFALVRNKRLYPRTVLL